MKVLFIGAHFDDIEIGCGGTAARMVAEGHDVAAMVVTHSGYNDENGNCIRERSIAVQEGLEGLAEIGIKEVHQLEMDTGRVEYGVELIHRMEARMKDIAPQMVFTHWTADVHQDHSAIGRATLNVCRKTGSVLMYRSNWYRSSVGFAPKIFVDTSEYFEVKKRAINRHVSEVTKFGQGWLRFVEAQDISVGMEFGYRFGEAFEPVKLDLFVGLDK